MRERLPLLIGVVGDSCFANDIGKHRELARHVTRRLLRTFRSLERDYPEVPKIVLTDAAPGAGLIAARVALRMNKGKDARRWGVALLLPVQQDLLAEAYARLPDDMSGVAWEDHCAKQRRLFDRLIGKAGPPDDASSRVMVCELPPLAHGRAGDAQDARAHHDEQAGQFIAESVNILIAVMPSDARPVPFADGSPPRIVTYRRAGRADDIGTDVARRSRILRSEWSDLVAPPARFVWLLDPNRAPPATRRRGPGPGARPRAALHACAERIVLRLHERSYPIDPLPPATLREEHSRKGLLRKLSRHCLAYVRPDEAAKRQQRIAAALTSAKAFRRFNKHRPTSPEVVAALTDFADISKESSGIAELISDTQMRINRLSRRSFYGLAALFVTAVFAFEAYAKFFPASPVALGIYLAALIAIAIIVLFARWRLWQAKSEDYRAIAEMLRVQRAWWAAGLTLRVDREHLQGADRDLARIRNAATAVIAWLLIRHRLKPPPVNWREVREEWIEGQLAYFSSKAPARHDRARIADAVSWTHFVASGFMAVILWAWLAEDRFLGTHAIYHGFANLASIFQPCDTPACPTGFLVWTTTAALVVWFRVSNRDLKGKSSIAATFALGLITAILLSFALVSSAGIPIAVFDLDYESEKSAKYLMVVFLVGLSAGAGAWRYVTERLNIEAEAHDYRDARQRFARAKALPALDVTNRSSRTAQKAARKIVTELGRLALAENEAWLKSRRERPLTPVVG